MVHYLYAPCQNEPIDFILSIIASFHLNRTSVLMFSLVLTQQHTHASYRLLRFQLISSLPQHALLSIPLSPFRFTPRCGFLEYILD
ncbi:unnamed protein product [Hymenolepis diminuta]|uniref:Uncharacterized protein n=1 Tax=Hymenolepis diminuta TaxID=6216 RepID=A0A564YME2_HYMDI|nr:unnamed protein product [Hymenolepis diminuta]